MWKTVEKKRRSKRKVPVDKQQQHLISEIAWCFDPAFTNRHYYFFPSAEDVAIPTIVKHTIFPWGLPFNYDRSRSMKTTTKAAKKKTHSHFLGHNYGPLTGTVEKVYYNYTDEAFSHAVFILRERQSNSQVYVFARKSQPLVFSNHHMEINEIYLTRNFSDFKRAFPFILEHM